MQSPLSKHSTWIKGHGWGQPYVPFSAPHTCQRGDRAPPNLIGICPAKRHGGVSRQRLCHTNLEGSWWRRPPAPGQFLRGLWQQARGLLLAAGSPCGIARPRRCCFEQASPWPGCMPTSPGWWTMRCRGARLGDPHLMELAEQDEGAAPALQGHLWRAGARSSRSSCKRAKALGSWRPGGDIPPLDRLPAGQYPGASSPAQCHPDPMLLEGSSPS